MNDYDVARMRELLDGVGFTTAASAEEADLIVLNSCSIREKSEHKVQSAVGRLRALKEQHPQLVVAVGGCVAQQEGERLIKRMPMCDFSFGPDQIPELPKLVERFARERRRFAATDVIDVEDYRFLSAQPTPGDVRGASALVTIQKGCDNHCAYCVVPATRGREVSRPADEVVAEVARFVDSGAREVMLIGQNVNSYHGIGDASANRDGDRDGDGNSDDFAELLRRVDAVPGLLRQRFTTSHPKDFTHRVAEAYVALPTLMPWLHLPVQAGSTRTLRRMVREYTRAEYVEKLDYVRGLVPDLSLSTDIIVGYPGETDADFAETLSLLEYAQYDSIYSFEYSPRPDTPALKLRLKDDVAPTVKAERLQAVQRLQKLITRQRLGRFVGRTVEVLVEGESQRGGQLCGRAPGNEMVNFPAPAVAGIAARSVGQLVRVEIVGVRAHTLEGVCAPGFAWPESETRAAPPGRSLRLPVVA